MRRGQDALSFSRFRVAEALSSELPLRHDFLFLACGCICFVTQPSLLSKHWPPQDHYSIRVFQRYVAFGPERTVNFASTLQRPSED